MIEVFEGRIGGGKTFYAVQRMIKYMASGGCVCTNIELKWKEVCEYVLKKYSWQLVPEQYIFLEDEKICSFHRHTPSGSPDMPSLVVIDEAHIWLNARDWDKQSRELLTFLTQSRKCFTDIIFISQSALNMDKQIMRLVQYIWRFRDMKKWRIAGIGIAWPLDQFLKIQYDQDGKTVMDRFLEFKEKAVYNLYYSYKLLRSFPRLEGRQVKFDGRVKKKGRRMKVIIVVILLGVIMGFWTWKKLNVGGGSVLKGGRLEDISKKQKTDVAAKCEKKVDKIPLVIYDHFRGVIEDGRGRVVFGDDETYVAGELCKIGKVVSVKDEMVVIAGYDGVPHVIKKKKFTSDELSGYNPAVPVDNGASYADSRRGLGGSLGAVISPERRGNSEKKSFDVSGGLLTSE